MYSDVFLTLFTSKFPKENLIIYGLVKIEIRRENVIIPKELEKKSITKPKINVITYAILLLKFKGKTKTKMRYMLTVFPKIKKLLNIIT